MGYRDQEVATRARLDVLRREETRLRSERDGLRKNLALQKGATKGLRTRLEEAGAGAGPRNVRRDRVGLAAMLLSVLCFTSLPFHIGWHQYIDHDLEVLFLIFWLGTPGILTLLVAWPYRKQSTPCRVAVRIGILFTALPLVNFLLAFFLR